MTLTEFLMARIAEDEKLARNAIQARYVEYETSPEWVYDGNPSGAFAARRKGSEDLAASVLIGQASSWDDSAQGGGRFARHWDPARVLAECEAKRCIVELHFTANGTSPDGPPCCNRCTEWDDYPYRVVAGDDPWPCVTLKLLALPYASHPDYDPLWRP